MKKIMIMYLVALLATIGLLFTSCQKEESCPDVSDIKSRSTAIGTCYYFTVDGVESGCSTDYDYVSRRRDQNTCN